MATTETHSAVLNFAYDDATSRNYTFNNLDESALSGIKNRVKTFNYILTSSDEQYAAKKTAYKETFISDDGASVAKIAKARYITTTEEVIYRD